MNESADHLIPAARALLGLTDAERIKHIFSRRWVGYPIAKVILGKVEDLFDHPRVLRMPNLLLTGATNNGKTTLIARFCSRHPAVDDPAGEHLSLPVLYVQCPPGPDEKRFYHNVLDVLHAPYKVSSRVETKHHQVKTLLSQLGTRVLLLDEIHNILAGPMQRQQNFLNVLKYLGNDLQIPIVGIGTADALNAITTDDQLANRFEPCHLSLWRNDGAFLSLLKSFESLLPLHKPSGFAQDEKISGELHRLCEGLIGELAAVLNLAARAAIRSKTEQITLKIIKSLNFVPPSKRREHLGKPDNKDSKGRDENDAKDPEKPEDPKEKDSSDPGDDLPQAA